MPCGRRQARSVAGWSAGAPVKHGSDGQGPAEAGDGRQKPRRNWGLSKTETDAEGPSRGQWRTAEAPVEAGADSEKRGGWRGRSPAAPVNGGSDDQGPAEAGDRRQKPRSKLGTDGEKPVDDGGSDAGSPGQNRRRPLILCRDLAMGLSFFSRKTGQKQFLRYSR